MEARRRTLSDYPGAIDYPAHKTNTLGPPNTPKGFVLHTPEEAADGYPGTPYWFAQKHPGQEGSTTYFVSFLGFVYQCVPESEAAIANGVLGKPYPAWANPAVSLNRQTLSVEIEGYAATIADTISPAQKTALLNLIRHRCEAHGIPLDRQHIIGHYEVANNRSDPGTLDIGAIVGELQQGDDMSQEQVDTLIQQMTAVLAALEHQKNLNIVNETVQGQVQGLLDAHPPGAHAGGAIEEIADSLKVVPK